MDVLEVEPLERGADRAKTIANGECELKARTNRDPKGHELVALADAPERIAKALGRDP